jgi:hypothetical protein
MRYAYRRGRRIEQAGQPNRPSRRARTKDGSKARCIQQFPGPRNAVPVRKRTLRSIGHDAPDLWRRGAVSRCGTTQIRGERRSPRGRQRHGLGAKKASRWAGTTKGNGRSPSRSLLFARHRNRSPRGCLVFCLAVATTVQLLPWRASCQGQVSAPCESACRLQLPCRFLLGGVVVPLRLAALNEVCR